MSQNVTVTLAVVAFWEGTGYKGTIVNFFKLLFIGNGGFANSSRKNGKKRIKQNKKGKKQDKKLIKNN